MMKSAALVLSLLMVSQAFAADDYVLTVNGKTYDIGLDSTKEISLPSGETLKFELKMKEEIQYDRPYFSFKHSSKFKPSTNDLGDGVQQTVLMAPEGAAIILQEYNNADPSFLIDVMLKEVTKEEITYGYKYKESKLSKDVGQRKVEGKRAVTTYKDDTLVREACSIKGRDCGLLILTTINTSNDAKEQYVIDKFWESLEIKKLQ